ncbi:MAG: hypothetical protein JST26_16335 [Bacteroidetes bacterium]|nr:hypothetical protein [Bacteroidota bacterium]
MRKLILLACLCVGLSAFSQNAFDIDQLPNILVHELNKFRIQNGLDTFDVNDVLIKAATIDATKMAKAGQVKVDPAAVQKNLVKAGGTKKGEEVAANGPVAKGRDNYKTEDVAKTILIRWQNNKKDKPIILNPQYTMIGIKCQMDKDSKKVYAIAVFGGYDSFNSGANKKKELAVPFNSKSKKLGTPDQKSCKNCDKWKNYDVLQKGLTVENGKIYLEYANMKDLKRILKKPKDGLAVDIVQRAQYEKPDYNIVDNNLQNKGVMQKVIYKDAVFSKNLIKPDPKAKKKVKINKLKIEMGKLDKKITGPYELNLIVVQDGHVCRTVTRSYLENNDQESNTPIGLLPAEESTGLKPEFEPRSESSILNFTIPFEKNKSEFKPEDIQPFINAMNEPDFIIDGLYIYAYSSIEGDANANNKLQHKRAESVVKVLQGMQQNKINPNIETKDSWNLFELEMEDGKYADLVKLGKEKAIRKINTDGALLKELEPILAKERFAQIVMDVTYDIRGDKEQKFSAISFNRAVKANNTKQAYKIMEYIFKQNLSKKYTDAVWDSLKMPNDPKYVNMFNNKVYYNYLRNNSMVTDDDFEEMSRLNKMDPANEIVKYNLLYCAIKLDSTTGNKDAQLKMQQDIDALYKTKIAKKLVDGLNIEWQFKIIESLDTIEGAEAQIDLCIAKIKGFYNFKEASWQNSLKLAYVFTRAKDYKFASGLLEPYLKDPNVNENLVYSYISIASHLPEKFYSRTFSDALHTAKEKNPERYCKLFGDPYMSFQALGNPNAKRDYTEAGCR